MYDNPDLLTVVRGCDFSTAEIYQIGEREWSARYGYSPMVRAFCCKELAGFTTEELHEYLADAERARALGFAPDQFAAGKTAPGRTTLGRAWRERFPERLKTLIQTAAERILGVAHEMGTRLACVRSIRSRLIPP